VVKVREVMHRALVTVSPDDSMRAAAETMQARQVRHLLVTDGEQRLLGIVTDRDLRHAAFLPLLARHLPWDSRRLGAPRVRDVMTWSVVTIGPDADLDRAASLMFERRVGSLPVTEGGRVVGMLTEREIFEALREEDRASVPPELFLG
jgi:acetoin utilization protein AcuB